MSMGLSVKPVTPGSVKALMAIEGVAVLLLGSWLYVEYNYSSSFRNVFNDLVFAHITTWTPIIGLSAGLVGSVAVLGVWRSLRLMRHRIETLELGLKETSRQLQERMLASVMPLARGPPESESQFAVVQPQAASATLLPTQTSAE